MSSKIVSINKQFSNNDLIKDIIKDKNKYFKMKDNKKVNFIFITKLLQYYKDDFNYVSKVVSDINKFDEDWIYEINIKYIRRYNLSMDYLMIKHPLIYCNTINETVSILSDIRKYTEKGKLFIAYKCLSTNYGGVVLEYLVDQMLLNFFCQLPLEKIMHEKYKTLDEFLTDFNKADKLIIEIINSYDKNLTTYIINHPNSINETKSLIGYIKGNWVNYENEKEKKILENIYNSIYEYVKIYKNTINFDINKMIIYIFKELNIKIEEKTDLNKNDFNEITKRHYLNIKKIIKKCINEEIIDFNEFSSKTSNIRLIKKNNAC